VDQNGVGYLPDETVDAVISHILIFNIDFHSNET